MDSAFVLVRTNAEASPGVQAFLRGVPGVVDVQAVQGDYDLVCRIHAADLVAVGAAVGQVMGAPGVLDARALLVRPFLR